VARQPGLKGEVTGPACSNSPWQACELRSMKNAGPMEYRASGSFLSEDCQAIVSQVIDGVEGNARRVVNYRPRCQIGNVVDYGSCAQANQVHPTSNGFGDSVARVSRFPAAGPRKARYRVPREATGANSGHPASSMETQNR